MYPALIYHSKETIILPEYDPAERGQQADRLATLTDSLALGFERKADRSPIIIVKPECEPMLERSGVARRSETDDVHTLLDSQNKKNPTRESHSARETSSYLSGFRCFQNGTLNGRPPSAIQKFDHIGANGSVLAILMRTTRPKALESFHGMMRGSCLIIILKKMLSRKSPIDKLERRQSHRREIEAVAF
ncbi:unnamed protein product, partial [Nesidiocoris tenuis]